MTDREQWSVAQVAGHCGVKPATIRAHMTRGEMPAPDGHIGRTPWWWSDRIIEWEASRPRKGKQ